MNKFFFFIIISIKLVLVLFAQTGFALDNVKIFQDDHLFDFNAPLQKGGFFKIKPTEKGDFFISLSIPEGNSFYIKEKNGYNKSFGFIGFTSEIGYFYKNNTYFSLGGGTALNSEFIIPSPVDPIGEYENSTVSFIEINHGHQIKRFTVGYGLQFSKTNFYHTFIKERFGDTLVCTGQDTLDYNIIENRFGICLKTKIKVTNFFQLGLNYMPSFMNADNFHDFHYTYLGYFNLIVTLNIKPTKKVDAKKNNQGQI